MKKLILLAFLVGFLPRMATAQPVASDLMQLGLPAPLAKYFEDNGVASNTVANNVYIKSANATPGGTAVSLIKDDAANSTHVNALSGKNINLDFAFTPAYVVDSAKITGPNAMVVAGPTTVALAAGAAGTPNYTFDNAKLLGPNAVVIAGPTTVALAAGAASTPNYTFDNAKILGPSTVVLAGSTAVAISAGAANTPNATVNNTGLTFTNAGAQDIFPVPGVITPSTSFPTPNAGDSLSGRYNLIASTAPTATFVELPLATPNVTKSFGVFNQAAANPVAVVPISGNSINALAAATPFSCAAGKFCDCKALTSTLYHCFAQ